MADKADIDMTHPAADPAALQREGTRQFDEAIAGKGPKMPPQSNAADEAMLDKALKDTFPASDPPAPASPKASPGAPKGRESA